MIAQSFYTASNSYLGRGRRPPRENYVKTYWRDDRRGEDRFGFKIELSKTNLDFVDETLSVSIRKGEKSEVTYVDPPPSSSGDAQSSIPSPGARAYLEHDDPLDRGEEISGMLSARTKTGEFLPGRIVICQEVVDRYGAGVAGAERTIPTYPSEASHLHATRAAERENLHPETKTGTLDRVEEPVVFAGPSDYTPLLFLDEFGLPMDDSSSWRT